MIFSKAIFLFVRIEKTIMLLFVNKYTCICHQNCFDINKNTIYFQKAYFHKIYGVNSLICPDFKKEYEISVIPAYLN